MPIGDSKGAFHETEFHELASPWSIDPKMEITPNKAETDKQLDKAELHPSTGMGIEISSDEIDWSKMNQELGTLKGTAPEDTPVVAKAAGGIKITEGDINQAINVGMGVGPGIIAGEKSFTAPARLLGKAMSKEGFKDSPESILKETGWYKGSDSKWRYEISDQGLKLADRDWKFGESGKLSDFIEHPELFKAYPELKDMKFKVADKDYKYIGGYNTSTKTLTINPDKVAAGDEGLLDVITHELQHAVQDKEGFSQGSNPDRALGKSLMELGGKIHQSTGAAKEELQALFSDIFHNGKKFGEYMYLRAPGEVEANSAAARRKLTDEQRKNIPIKDMEKLFEGTDNGLHGGKYVPEFNYPN